jgi:hypothetical protein
LLEVGNGRAEAPVLGDEAPERTLEPPVGFLGFGGNHEGGVMSGGRFVERLVQLEVDVALVSLGRSWMYR